MISHKPWPCQKQNLSSEAGEKSRKCVMFFQGIDRLCKVRGKREGERERDYESHFIILTLYDQNESQNPLEKHTNISTMTV